MLRPCGGGEGRECAAVPRRIYPAEELRGVSCWSRRQCRSRPDLVDQFAGWQEQDVPAPRRRPPADRRARDADPYGRTPVLDRPRHSHAEADGHAGPGTAGALPLGTGTADADRKRGAPLTGASPQGFGRNDARAMLDTVSTRSSCDTTLRVSALASMTLLCSS